MQLFKRITGLILVLSIVLSMGVPVAADERDEKAELLNKLTILRGDGTGYNFDGQLKRSEAATFIVRMLGKDSLVTDHPDNYKRDTFSDVKDTDWFSPYVGYCVQESIVGGFDDGTFRPNDYVSEKAFLKMLMTAMGYKYEEDFDWSEVYSYAYEISLVTSTSYKTKINDNYSYTRGDVFNVLFDALSSVKKDSDETMIQYFIDEKIITEKDAIELGVIQDKVDTEVSDIELIDEKTIAITFNETLKDLDKDQVVVYEKDNKSKELDISKISADSSSKIFTVTFAEDQEPNRDYGIVMDDLLDNYGNKTDSLSAAFSGYKPAVVESNYFRISYAEAASSHKIYVYFTHPVNINIAQANFFTLTQGSNTLSSPNDVNISVGLMGSQENGIAITLNNAYLEKDKEYELAISGKATSQYGVTLQDGDGDEVTFEGVEKDESPFKMTQANAINTSTVELVFNKEINEILAEQVFSYYMTTTDGSPIEITKATLLEDGMTVRLMVDYTLRDKTDYKIMLNNVMEVTGESSITLSQQNFTSYFYDDSNEDVTFTASSTDNNTILLKLSAALDEEAANKPSNYKIEGITEKFSATPMDVYYDPDVDPLKVKLYLNPADDLVEDDKYEVTMSDSMVDGTGIKQDDDQADTFKHKSNVASEVYIESAVAVGSSTIKITFNKEVALDVPNVLNTNYSLLFNEDGITNTKVPISANYIDPLTMIVHFDQLDSDINYEITFEALVDYAGNKTNNSGHSYKESVVID